MWVGVGACAHTCCVCVLVGAAYYIHAYYVEIQYCVCVCVHESLRAHALDGR